MNQSTTFRNTAIAATLSILLLLVSRSSAFASSSSESRNKPRADNRTDHGDAASCAADNNNKISVDFHPNDKRLLLYHFESTSSTQDEAKRIAEAFTKNNEVKTFCVTTTSQSSGRGTSGRQWLGAPGNVFVTIGVPMNTWMKQTQNVPLTLLPLKVGELTAHLVQKLLDECRSTTQPKSTLDPFVTVKWPNDVLCDGRKISGTLIESANGWFLIGVGINLEYAPAVPTSGKDHGRPSTSVSKYCPDSKDTKQQQYSKAHQAGVELAYSLHHWLHSEASWSAKTADAILNGWQQFVDWDMELIMRDTPERERVKLLEVLPDGRVKVRNLEDGSERVLVSDYFL